MAPVLLTRNGAPSLATNWKRGKHIQRKTLVWAAHFGGTPQNNHSGDDPGPLTIAVLVTYPLVQTSIFSRRETAGNCWCGTFAREEDQPLHPKRVHGWRVTMVHATPQGRIDALWVDNAFRPDVMSVVVNPCRCGYALFWPILCWPILCWPALLPPARLFLRPACSPLSANFPSLGQCFLSWSLSPLLTNFFLFQTWPPHIWNASWPPVPRTPSGPSKISRCFFHLPTLFFVFSQIPRSFVELRSSLKIKRNPQKMSIRVRCWQEWKREGGGQSSQAGGTPRCHRNTTCAFQVSIGLRMVEHRRPKIGDTPHKNLVKIENWGSL